jgi:hypothetical protein
MDGEIKQKEPRKVVDVTKPHTRQFFECVEKPGGGDATRGGFWKPPRHGLKINKEK